MDAQGGREIRFHEVERSAQRKPRPWNRLAYIARRLPTAIGELATELGVRPGDRVLDYGCADVPYRSLFPADVDYLTADLPGNPMATVEIEGDGRLPLPDDSVDAILSTQVLEHVGDPAIYLSECERVLRPGGRMLLTTHGIMVYHPDPVDLWRWTCEGLQLAVRDAGLEVIDFDGIMGLGATGIQLFQDSIYHRLPHPLASLLALLAQSAIAIADRFEPSASRRTNALVFAVIAEKR